MRNLLWLSIVTVISFVLCAVCLVVGFVYGDSNMFCTGYLIFLPFSIFSFFAYRKEWHKYEKRHGRYN